MARLKTATRTLHNAGHRKIIGLIPSLKNGAMAPWESQIERDLFYLLEFDRSVDRYVPQPEQIPLIIDGVLHTYTPDCKVHFTNGSIGFLEAKPEAKANAPEAKDLFTAARDYYSGIGADYRVVLDTELRVGFQMENLRLLYRYRSLPTHSSDIQHLLQRIPPTSMAITVLEAAVALEDVLPQSQALHLVYHALFTQVLRSDLIGKRISPDSVVWKGDPT